MKNDKTSTPRQDERAGLDSLEHFMTLFAATFPHESVKGFVWEVGAAGGDLARRFSRAYPSCLAHATDGDSETVYYQGRPLGDGDTSIPEQALLAHGLFPDAALTSRKYDTVISYGLLRCLKEPATLLRAIRGSAAINAKVFLMDFVRPDSPEKIERLANELATGEPGIVRERLIETFRHAPTQEQAREWIKEANLESLTVCVDSECYLIIKGRVNPPPA